MSDVNPSTELTRQLILTFSRPNHSHLPKTYDNSDQTKLITFVITFLSGEYVKNPFVKSKLVEVSRVPCR